MSSFFKHTPQSVTVPAAARPQNDTELFYSLARKNPRAFNTIIHHAKTTADIRQDVANWISGIIDETPVFLKIAKDAPKQFEKLSELAKYDDSILYSFIAAAKMDDPKIAELSKYILEKLSQDPAIKAKIDSYQEPEMPVGFNI